MLFLFQPKNNSKENEEENYGYLIWAPNVHTAIAIIQQSHEWMGEKLIDYHIYTVGKDTKQLPIYYSEEAIKTLLEHELIQPNFLPSES